MPNTIRIKRSAVTSAPPALLHGELAYSELSGNLFIGTTGNTIEVIGGKAVLDLIATKAALIHTHTSADITDLITTIDTRIQNIVGAAPAALDTLNELAAALGNDPNFAATINAQLANKAALNHTHVVADITDLMFASATDIINGTPNTVVTSDLLTNFLDVNDDIDGGAF